MNLRARQIHYFLVAIFGLFFVIIASNFPAFANTAFEISSLDDFSVAQGYSSQGGRAYYVSPSGDDSDTGNSPSHAWKTTARVNHMSFAPGDQILFQGGSLFEGGLEFDVDDVGTTDSPILISSYREGRATIFSNEYDGLWAHNTSGISIIDIDFISQDKSINHGSGINFFNDLPNNIRLEHVYIERVSVAGFHESGILIGGWNHQSGYRDVTIKSVITHNNGNSGIIVYAEEANTHQNINISYVEAFDNFGIAGERNPTGNGIVLGGVDHGRIEYSLAYNNGRFNNSASGPVGIWTYDSSHITIQHNESYHNQTGGLVDGDGFDLDQNVSFSVLQYNYSHDNEGAGYLLSHGVNNSNHAHNVIRYNVSHNDGLRNSYAGIYLYGKIKDLTIYNNTVISNELIKEDSLALKIVNYGVESLSADGILVCNNHFESERSALIEVAEQQLVYPDSIRFIRNNYYSGNDPPEIRWGNQLYVNLQQWRIATGQEEFEFQSMEQNVDPQLIGTNDNFISGTQLVGEISNRQYLPASSRLIDQGVNLSELFDIDPGRYDFYGTPIPQGNQYDIGAYEWKPDFLRE